MDKGYLNVDLSTIVAFLCRANRKCQVNFSLKCAVFDTFYRLVNNTFLFFCSKNLQSGLWKPIKDVPVTFLLWSLGIKNRKCCENYCFAKSNCWAILLVAQSAKQLLLTPEVRGSNPIDGKVLLNIVYFQVHWKDKNKEKEAGNDPF